MKRDFPYCRCDLYIITTYNIQTHKRKIPIDFEIMRKKMVGKITCTSSSSERLPFCGIECDWTYVSDPLEVVEVNRLGAGTGCGIPNPLVLIGVFVICLPMANGICVISTFNQCVFLVASAQ